jgi:hypothetical protein
MSPADTGLALPSPRDSRAWCCSRVRGSGSVLLGRCGFGKEGRSSPLGWRFRCPVLFTNHRGSSNTAPPLRYRPGSPEEGGHAEPTGLTGLDLIFLPPPVPPRRLSSRRRFMSRSQSTDSTPEMHPLKLSFFIFRMKEVLRCGSVQKAVLPLVVA